jgi:excisionase family DNA binding protein
MAKMYYTEQEAADRLGLSSDQLLEKVRAGDLHAYADGSNRMFKVVEVDQIADAKPVSSESDIQLSPVEMSGTHTPVSLADTEDHAAVSSVDTKSDTVVTSEGISIFEDEDLALQEADPMAKTQIAPSLDEGMGLEGMSSGGSGLLDLTREGDDTSLGSEVLDHIDMESGEMPSVESVSQGLKAEIAAAAPAAVAITEYQPVYDPAVPMFTGMAAAGAIIAVLLGMVAVGILAGKTSPVATALGAKVGIVAAAAFGLAIVTTLIGFAVGKKGAAPQS